MKDGSINTPKTNLGANIKTWKLKDEDGTNSECWAMSSKGYARKAVRIVEVLMENHELNYISTRRYGSKTPFSSCDYRPEVNTSNFCSNDIITVYQNLMMMLRWLCELGRLDLLYEVALLASYMTQPELDIYNKRLTYFII